MHDVHAGRVPDARFSVDPENLSIPILSQGKQCLQDALASAFLRHLAQMLRNLSIISPLSKIACLNYLKTENDQEC